MVKGYDKGVVQSVCVWEVVFRIYYVNGVFFG